MSGANVVLPGGRAEAEASTAVLTRTECRRGRGAAVVWSRWQMFAWLPAALLGMAAWGAEETHTVPYVPSASSEGHAGLVRIESRSAVPGEVRIMAVDDAGQRMAAGLLTLGAGAAVEFEMAALESGDASLGLAGTGPGEGDWRLELTTELDIEARAYARSEGFLTALHDAALLAGEVELPLFHPGGDARPRGVLRLANAGAERATVAVRGVDDAGRAGGPVTVELAAWESRGYAASELESGSAAGLSGSLGDGEGKWRLMLEAERGSAYATNLLLDGSVLSSVPGSMSRGAGGLHRVSLFPSASDGSGRRGVVRVVNRSPESAEVSIDAFDATDRAYERSRLSLGGDASADFDSTDLEQGNSEKGLTGSTGSGEGDWWLELTSGSDIEVLSYVDMATGPLSAVRGTAGVETGTGMRYEALLAGESGELRLLNAGGGAVAVRVSGTDDAGAPGGEVELTLAPWASRTLAREALEEGEAGLRGALGSGTGSWRLILEADGEIDVLSLVRGAGGMLSDVSRRGRPAGAPPRTDVIDATASRADADLRVAASASEAELSPGEAFDLTATVGNRGEGEASATTLRYYRSADATITTGDTEVGTDAVAALAAAQSIARSLSLVAPTAPGTYRYGACADAVAEETNTANNCSAAVAVTVREPPRQPDLEVTATLSDAVLEPGESFSLTATVRNRGGAAAATTLRYHRSADATITTTDAQVGTDAVEALAASGSSAESIALTAPSTAGTYYYGACADAVAEETNTANNCSAAVVVTVREPPLRPDLAVTATLSDAALEPGESFTLSATVTNAGDGAAAATTLRYHRSADAEITTTDAQVGTDAVEALAASGSSAESIALTAPSTAGTYYYGACADAVAEETNTANNCSAAVVVTVREPPLRPDLAVTATLSDAALEPGGSFTLTATVTNAGDGAAAATTLRYHRSADAEITTTDAQVGTDAVEALAASGSSAESIALTAPSTAGTYYYGACADAVEGESDTTDNCSSPVGLDVAESTAPDPAPDLEVGTPTVDDASLEPGESFTLSATVTNAGDGSASATTLRYHRSADGTITTTDAQVGTDAVEALAASGSSAESISLTAPSTAGTYYYGACADAVEGESDTTDNCSSPVGLDVAESTAPDPAPDLEVGTPTVDDASPEPGGSFTLSATVTNAGDGAAAATTLRYHRSADATITTTDAQVGTDAVEALAASGSSAESIALTAPSTAGTYYYGACADAVEGESDTTDNCSSPVGLDVAESTAPDPAPDLEVGTPTVDDASPETGGSFTLTATVTNAGDGSASATTLRYHRSADATITTTDAQVGTDAVEALAASGSSAESIALTAPSTAGTYYYGACADAVEGESDTTDNCSSPVGLDVAESTAPDPAPDLEVGTPTVDDASPEPGGSFTLTATVTNAGDGSASATTLRYHRSADATITTTDAQVGTDAVDALAASGTSAESIALTAPSTSGTYYYGACVDAVQGESDTTNNCSAAVEVEVAEPTAPDLEVGTPTVDDASPETEESFTLSATVTNAGDGSASATTLRYHRSADATITTTDAQVGTDAVDALAASGTSAESVRLTAPSNAGTYYYGACVDAVPEESATSNNCSAAVTVTVREPAPPPPPAPDLDVGNVAMDNACMVEGGAFTLSAAVTNAGDGAASATTLRYYRSADATITTSDAEEGAEAVDELAASGTSAESISLTAPATAGTYYYGACVDAVEGELDTTDNCSSSVPLYVGGAPDLHVPWVAMSWFAPNERIIAAWVANRGSGCSTTTTLRFYRSPGGWEEGSALVGHLAAGATSAKLSITVQLPSEPGTYDYGFCVDEVPNELDTTDNCSWGVKAVVD